LRLAHHCARPFQSNTLRQLRQPRATRARIWEGTPIATFYLKGIFMPMHTQTVSSTASTGASRGAARRTKLPEGFDPLMRFTAVCAATALSRTTIYKLVREGKFPMPLHLGQRGQGFEMAWPESEIRAWIDSRKAERDERARKLLASAATADAQEV
jgi:prophage regulatory protein